MKKYKIFISFLLALTILVCSSVCSVAQSNMNSGLWLYSKLCPQDVVDYAIENYSDYVQSAIDARIIEIDDKNVYLGSPFSIFNTEGEYDIFYFPIINNDLVIGSLCVYPDITGDCSQNSYAGIFSVFLAKELNQLSSQNNLSPILLYYGVDGIYSYSNNQAAKIVNNDTNYAISYDKPDFDPQAYVCTDDMAVAPFGVLSCYYATTNTRATGYLNLSIIETQGAVSWCGAFATAAIIRTLTGNSTSPTAYSLMCMYYGTPASTDRFYLQYSVQTGQIYGYSPTYITSRLSNYTVYAEINAGKPIYINCSCYDSSTLVDYHAMVITGYSTNNNTYTVWNPWYSTQVIMSSTSYNYYDSPHNYWITWQETIYGW